MAAPQAPLSIAYVAPSASFVWEQIAYDRGLFKKYGVDVGKPIFVGGTPRLAQALVAGSFQLAGVGMSAVIEADAKGEHLEAVAAMSDFNPMYLVVSPGSSITSPSQLRGKTIGVAQYGDVADSFLTVALRKYGLTRHDVTILQTGSHPNTLKDVLAKKYAAGVVSNVFAFIGEQRGARVLTSGPRLHMLATSGAVVVRRPWAQAHRAALLGVLKAMIAANRVLLNNQSGGLAALRSTWFKSTAAPVLLRIWRSTKATANTVPLVSKASVTADIRTESIRNPKVASVKPGSLYDNSYLRSLEASGFISGGSQSGPQP